ncbi:MAG: hypothetical protein AAGA91_08675 [Pseudomonadota bacterium]
MSRSLLVRHRQQGIALALVVWFIAGMSLLVAGIVSQARVDTKLAQLHVSRAKAAASGDGAITMLLADHYLNPAEIVGDAGASQRRYRLGDTSVLVSLQPAAGLINLDLAPPEQLLALFVSVGGLNEQDARQLADNMVQWRAGATPTGRGATGNRFHAVEDLLQIEGMNRSLFDILRDYVVAGTAARSGMDWSVAPAALLPVLELSDPQQLTSIERRRQRMANENALGPPTAADGGSSRGLSGAYRADAWVTYGNSTWLRRRWVSMGADPNSALPWRTERTEAPRVVRAAGAL